jgi:segregation and condensation protein B
MTSDFTEGLGNVPASDGVAGDGVATDSPASDAPASDGVATDSPASDAPASDGVATDSRASDGPSSDGVVSDGVVSDGQVGDEVPVAEAGDDAENEEIDGPGVRACLEAILLVADEPVPEVLLAQVIERPRGEIDAALRALAAEYTADGRGFDLREIAGGWRFYTREDCAPLVERFVRDGQEVRLTQAALETLAVIAYRQPVSRARVSAVRGVNCDGVIRTLVLRGLVEDSGTDQETGAILYRTTSYFLERLGMASLNELPDLAPFLPEDIEDIEDNERTRA